MKWTDDKIETARRMAAAGSLPPDIHNATGMSLRSIYRLLAATHPLAEGDPRREFIIRKRGRKTANNDQRHAEIMEQLANNGTASLRGIAQNLSQDVTCHASTISRHLSARGWTKKRVQFIPAERNSPRVIEERRRYAMQVSVILDSNLIFVDETGFNLHLTPAFAWSPRGVTPSVTAPGNRGRNISVIAAIGVNGMLAYELVDGAVSGETMAAFFRDKLFQVGLHEKTVVIDNARIHHSSMVTGMFQQNGHRLVFLPPYSPQLNPIEETFSMVKSRYTQVHPAPSNREQVKNLIRRILDGLSNYNFSEFFRHMRGFLDVSFAGQPFV